MNRSKLPMFNKARKKMSKAIRSAENALPSSEMRKYSDVLTAKEMLKKHPKKQAEKQEKLLIAIKKSITAKKAKGQKKVSKRTAPGPAVPADSTPANIHREGKRWIKVTTEQISAQRTIKDHHGRKK